MVEVHQGQTVTIVLESSREVREMKRIMDWACEHAGNEVLPMLVGDEPDFAEIQTAANKANALSQELK